MGTWAAWVGTVHFCRRVVVGVVLVCMAGGVVFWRSVILVFRVWRDVVLGKTDSESLAECCGRCDGTESLSS